MSRGGLCQAAPAAPSTPRPGPYGRMAWQPATAAVHSRFADKSPTFVSLVVGSESTPDPGERTLPDLMDGATAGPQRERPLSSP